MIRKMSRTGSITVLSFIILMLLFATIFSSGCVNKILQKNPAETGTSADNIPQSSTGTGIASAVPRVTTGSVQQVPVVEMTPVKSEAVMEVAPILTPDPYPVLHATRINDTPLYNRLDRGLEFEKTYHLDGNANGLLVNVVEGPLYIVYTVTPKYDCMAHPDSCRGNLEASVNRPYMTITVRDNQTREIVAEDGYAREFSSDTGKYTFISSGSGSEGGSVEEGSSGEDSGDGGSTTTTSGPRYVPIYKEGTYHITIEGAYLDVDVKIMTGSMPSNLEIKTGAVATPPPEQASDEMWVF